MHGGRSTADAGTESVSDGGAMIEAYAESAGVPIEEARVRIAQEDQLSVSMAKAEIEPISSSMDTWLEDDTGELVLHVRSIDAESLSLARVAAREAGISMVMEAGSAFVAERTEQVSAKAAELTQSIPGLMGFYIDPETGELVLDVYSDEAVVAAQQSVPVNATAKAERATGLSSRVNALDGPAHDMSTFNGGVAVNSGMGTSVGICTAAFPGTYKVGTTTYQGFFTAAHCGTNLSYFYNTAGSGSVKGATYRTRVYGANADIAFHSVAPSDTVSDKFFGSSTTSLTATGYELCAASGSTVCQRGRVSGYSCGKVQSTTYTPTYSNACNGISCAAVFVKTGITSSEGDSGGPVWSGSGNPVGIVKAGDAGGLFGIGAFTVYSQIGYRPAGTSLK